MTHAETDDGSALGDGHVVLVTGSTDGIGAETARNLAETGATVLVHGRDRQKGERLVASLPGTDHAFYAADFTDPAAIRDLAEAVSAEFDRLDVLVNNAGTFQSQRRLVDLPGSDEGVEMTFAVNHLGPFLLTNLLADRLAATGELRASDAPDGERDPARVVTVSSDLHRDVVLDLDGVRGPAGPSGMDAYNHSKLANVLFTAELAQRLPDSVTANSCHPGVSPTTALTRESARVFGLVWSLYGVVGGALGRTDSPAESAETQTYLARSPDVTGVTGEYFDDCEPVAPGDGATDRDAQRRLWRASVEWVGLAETEEAGTERAQRA
ncbi:SDR family NAD(P)-dependent oxidoreductase [Halosimplex aquaticum]|uniref:SDR family NAD(P)-dependent oxidoreductase n=1 Tax=Halosimplex aquaticum TaxID=3026162 RepID=A0ABD5Y1H4_9EURY|nr:SDR family NAD(P)-dependent oxidoreductase [Halosimplex aquaticum]